MPVCTRIWYAALSTDSSLFMLSCSSVTVVTLLAGLMAKGVGAAAEGSGTGLLSQLGCVRIELPGHVKGAVLWNALRNEAPAHTPQHVVKVRVCAVTCLFNSCILQC